MFVFTAVRPSFSLVLCVPEGMPICYPVGPSVSLSASLSLRPSFCLYVRLVSLLSAHRPCCVPAFRSVLTSPSLPVCLSSGQPVPPAWSPSLCVHLPACLFPCLLVSLPVSLRVWLNHWLKQCSTKQGTVSPSVIVPVTTRISVIK